MNAEPVSADERQYLSEKIQAEIAFGQRAEGVLHSGRGMEICCLAM